MNFSFDMTLRGTECEVEVNFVPSDNGDRWTPPSGDDLDILKIKVNGEEVEWELTPYEEDVIFDEAKDFFEVNYKGQEPDDE